MMVHQKRSGPTCANEHKADPTLQPALERMKIMSHNNSATKRDEIPHITNATNNQTISAALKRRAQFVIDNKSIDAETRAIIRYAREIKIRGSESWRAA